MVLILLDLTDRNKCHIPKCFAKKLGFAQVLRPYRFHLSAQEFSFVSIIFEASLHSSLD